MTQTIERPVSAPGPDEPQKTKRGLKDRWNALSLRGKVGLAAAGLVALGGVGVAAVAGGGDGANKDPGPGATAESDKPIEFGPELAKRLASCDPTTFAMRDKGGNGIESVSNEKGGMTLRADINAPSASIQECIDAEKPVKTAGIDIQRREGSVRAFDLTKDGGKMTQNNMFSDASMSDPFDEVKRNFIDPIHQGHAPEEGKTMEVGVDVDPHSVQKVAFGLEQRVTIANSAGETITATVITPITDEAGNSVLQFDSHGATGTGAENAAGAANIENKGGYNLLQGGVDSLQPYELVTRE